MRILLSTAKAAINFVSYFLPPGIKGSIFIDSPLITLQRLVDLKTHSYNKGYKDIKVVTEGRANFNHDSKGHFQITDRIGLRCDFKQLVLKISSISPGYAGINLTGYHSSPPPGAFAPKCVPSPSAFAQQKMPGGGPIKDDVPGAGHLHQLAFKHENY